MNNHKRRNYRSRQQKNGFRRRSNSSSQNLNGHFSSNGNNNFNRNPSTSNPFNVEKTIQKFKQLAKNRSKVVYDVKQIYRSDGHRISHQDN